MDTADQVTLPDLSVLMHAMCETRRLRMFRKLRSDLSCL